MRTKGSHRVLAVLEKRLYGHVTHLARRDGVSLSQKVRDLVREAVERDEDADLLALVIERRKKGGRFIPHEAFWKQRGVR